MVSPDPAGGRARQIDQDEVRVEELVTIVDWITSEPWRIAVRTRKSPP
jgi:hypothetical protein